MGPVVAVGEAYGQYVIDETVADVVKVQRTECARQWSRESWGELERAPIDRSDQGVMFFLAISMKSPFPVYGGCKCESERGMKSMISRNSRDEPQWREGKRTKIPYLEILDQRF